MHGSTLLYCPVRKKWVARTPEEEVRQAMIKHLNITGGFPLHLMSCEYPLAFNQRAWRADLVIFNNLGRTLLLGEFKAPDVLLNQEALLQLQRYNTVLHATYLLLTNGRQTFCCAFNLLTGLYDYLEDIPTFAP